MIKKNFTHLQWISLLLLSFSALILSGQGLRYVDPTVGIFDLGFVQSVFVATFFSSFSFAFSFLSLQLACPSIDGWLDREGFRHAWCKLRERDQVVITLCAISFFSLYWGFCLFLVIR